MNVVRLLHVAVHFAWTDLLSRYRRTILGPLWMSITLGFGSTGLGILWSQIWNMPPHEIIPTTTFGFLIWMFISGCINESTNVFTDSGDIIKSLKVPIIFFPMVALFRQFFNFVHAWPIIIIVMMIYPPETIKNLWLFFPSLMLCLVNIFLVMIVIGVICVRYRDVPPLINAIMPMLFFLSPVLFKASQIEGISWIILINPLTHYIFLLRTPLEGSLIMPSTLIIVAAHTLLLISACIYLLRYKSNRIVFWV